jgi:rubrerythrin
MKLCTASETLSFLRDMEETSAKFYETLAAKFSQYKQVFLSYATENRKFNKQIQMAYQSVITDAIEGCYAFDLDTSNYNLDTALEDNVNLKQALLKALSIEQKIFSFYDLGAEQSGPLLADVPRNFRMIMKKRSPRIETLKSLS